MNFSLYIAKRYLISKSSSNAINIITWIASIGIIISTLALFVVLSVFSGLRDFSLSHTNELQADLTVYPNKGKVLAISEEQSQKIKIIEGVENHSKFIEEKALLLFNNKETIATLKGVDSNYTKVIPIINNLYVGEWLKEQSPQVVIGYGIAHKLSVGLYDYSNVFQIYMPRAGKGTINNPEKAFIKQNVIPTGIYSVNEDIDLKYMYSTIDLAQKTLELKTNDYSGIEIKLSENADEETVREALHKIFDNQIVIKNKIELNDALYKMLNTENLVVYLIFTLVMIIALFNLIGSIIMIILEKKNNLKTLFNLGVTIKQLRHIFLFQGCLLTLSSSLIGLFLGIIVVLLQQQFALIKITSTLAYPVQFELKNIMIVLLTIGILGYLASYISSRVVKEKTL